MTVTKSAAKATTKAKVTTKAKIKPVLPSYEYSFKETEFDNSCDCPECDSLTEPHTVNNIGDGMVRCFYQCTCGCDWDREMEPSNVC
jgi:hypothetical protein